MTSVAEQSGPGFARRGLLVLRKRRDLLRAKRRRAATAPIHEYVVILTYGRTGSTVLQAALNSVDGVCVRGENNAALNHLRNFYESTRRTRADHGGGAASDTGNPWFGAHLIDDDGLLDDLRAAFVERVLRPPAGAKVAGFKEIRHTCEHFVTPDDLLEYVVFLDRLLPGVRFVVNTRNVEDTNRSSWWREYADAEQVLTRSREWLLELPARIDAKLGPGRVVTLEYDDWNGNPDALHAMLERLGLDGDIERLRAISANRLTHMRNFRSPARPADAVETA